MYSDDKNDPRALAQSLRDTKPALDVGVNQGQWNWGQHQMNPQVSQPIQGFQVPTSPMVMNPQVSQPMMGQYQPWNYDNQQGFQPQVSPQPLAPQVSQQPAGYTPWNYGQDGGNRWMGSSSEPIKQTGQVTNSGGARGIF